MDLVYLGLMAVFYVAVAGFAGACERLGQTRQGGAQ
ncbi:potassium ABC transporter ATPase [Janthinobacterium sp. PC23-8]|nr:potassium ABC transporter ATPase [Janthinobacterium sp. PC23-8]